MNDMILTMLQSIIILAIALLSIYAVKFLIAKTNQAKNALNNELANKYLDEASNAVTTAVLQTAQTYVDVLKESDSFSIDNQKEALKKSIETAKAQMTTGATEFIQTAYGDVNKFLESKIEAEIKALSYDE